MRGFGNHEIHERHERGKGLRNVFVWFVYFAVGKLWEMEVRE